MALGGATIRPNPTGLLILFAVCVVFVFYVNSGNKWWRTDSQVSLKELLSVSIDLAATGGSNVRRIQERALRESKKSENENALHAKSKGQTKEGANEVVTEGDLNSHRAIVYGFNKAFPGLHLISEEHDIKPPDFKAIPIPIKNLAQVNDLPDEKVAMSAVTVWIDPLDATHEYSLMRKDQNDYVTVMICVAVHGRPVIGVVHQPFLSPPAKDSTTSPNYGSSVETSSNDNNDGTAAEGDTSSSMGRTYWAWVGRDSNIKVPATTTGATGASSKASSDGSTSPKMSSASDQSLPRVIISQSHPGIASAVLNSSFHNLTLIKAGGAGFKTISVIEKNADLYYHHTRIKKWDICAGDALITAVGGRMTTLSGDLIDYSYDLTKAKQINDEKLVVALKDKHEEYRRKLVTGLKEFDRMKKLSKTTKRS